MIKQRKLGTHNTVHKKGMLKHNKGKESEEEK
jgi:hypothetical protein